MQSRMLVAKMGFLLQGQWLARSSREFGEEEPPEYGIDFSSVYLFFFCSFSIFYCDFNHMGWVCLAVF